MPRQIPIFDSISQTDDATSAIVVVGSHGSMTSERYASQLGLTGVIFNDLGVGRENACIRSLSYFFELNCSVATIDYQSIRIAGEVDMARNGAISHVNDIGDRPGQNTFEYTATMHDASVDPVWKNDANEYSRNQTGQRRRSCLGVDSIVLISDRHDGAIMIIGSYGEQLSTKVKAYVLTEIAEIILFHSGVGKDDSGIGRLTSMVDRGIPATGVNVNFVYIGDAQSAWVAGVFSHVNDSAAGVSIESEDTSSDFADRIREHKQKEKRSK